MRQKEERKLGKRLLKGIIAFSAVALLQTGVVPAANPAAMVYAAEKNTNHLGLGTGEISNPVHPASNSSAWSGSYVYYGKYNESDPTKYRVLDKEATKFGGNTLFLDCDSVLYNDYFNKQGDIKPGAQKPNEWAYSDVKTGLSGNKFLEKGGVFSQAEKDAMALSTIAEHPLDTADQEEAGKVSSWSQGAYGKYVPLSNEKVFLLDAEDASNINYGYSMDDNSCENRKKTKNGSASWWWLRSADSYYDDFPGHVYDGGYLIIHHVISSLVSAPLLMSIWNLSSSHL